MKSKLISLIEELMSWGRIWEMKRRSKWQRTTRLLLNLKLCLPVNLTSTSSECCWTNAWTESSKRNWIFRGFQTILLREQVWGISLRVHSDNRTLKLIRHAKICLMKISKRNAWRETQLEMCMAWLPWWVLLTVVRNLHSSRAFSTTQSQRPQNTSITKSNWICSSKFWTTRTWLCWWTNV